MRPRADEAPTSAREWPFDEAALVAELPEAVPVFELLLAVSKTGGRKELERHTK